MKKNIGKIIIIAIIICIMIFAIVIMTNKKSDDYRRPNYSYTAVIYHSEMLGMDAGTEYIYYIYKAENADDEYFYIKSKSNITIAGSGKQIDIDSGVLKNKNDLKKITADIKKDSRKDSQTYTSYNYVNNGNNEKIDNINELGNKLFYKK